jgi:hypothetical protein
LGFGSLVARGARLARGLELLQGTTNLGIAVVDELLITAIGYQGHRKCEMIFGLVGSAK